MPRLMLTAAVAAGFKTIDAGYEIAKIGQLLDILNLMAYDLHGKWEKITGHHTAMADDGGNTDDREKLTVPYAVDYWIKGGFPAHKIALGMGTYGRAYNLQSPAQHGLAAATPQWSSSAPKGQYTREAGFLAYYEICDAGYTVVKKNSVQAPYGYKGNAWVGFDDQDSLIHKVKTQVKAKGLAGAMFWCLDLDDFTGKKCNQGKYPLITAVAKALGGYTPPPTQSPPTRGPTTKRPKTERPDTPRPTKRPNTPRPTKRPNTPRPTSGGKCKYIGRGPTASRDQWCQENCAAGYCPKNLCKC